MSLPALGRRIPYASARHAMSSRTPASPSHPGGGAVAPHSSRRRLTCPCERGAQLCDTLSLRRRHTRHHACSFALAVRRPRPHDAIDHGARARTRRTWEAHMEVQTLVRNWWMVATRGLLAIMFGLAV